MTTLTKRIMRRVYLLWSIRYVLPRLVATTGLFWVTLRITANSFFVSKIFANFLNVAFGSVWAAPKFAASALSSAEPQVLVLISACGISGFFLAIKLLRSIRSIVANKNFATALSKTK
mgnify:CR=1 FL=1